MPSPRSAAPFVALVLAGRRASGDPLAAREGVSHKALLAISGVPMLLRVLRSLRAVSAVERILVSIDEPSALGAEPEIRRLIVDGSLEVWESRASPSASVLDCLERLAPPAPLLVTTADHPLLMPSMLAHFCAGARASEADAVVGVVTEATVRAGYPKTRRTFLRLRGERVTGANLFAFSTPEARRVAAFWRRAEAFRKRPWRLAGTLGPLALARFALGRLDLEGALDRVSARSGARVEALRLPFAECAIDVDGPGDLRLAEEALARRGADSPASPITTSARHTG